MHSSERCGGASVTQTLEYIYSDTLQLRVACEEAERGRAVKESETNHCQRSVSVLRQLLEVVEALRGSVTLRRD